MAAGDESIQGMGGKEVAHTTEKLPVLENPGYEGEVGNIINIFTNNCYLYSIY